MRGVAQDLVACKMTKGVVGSLEIVDVGQDDGKWVAFAVGPVYLQLKDVEDRGTIPKISQSIMKSLAGAGFRGP
jgi:hypothetical protein